MKFLILNTDYSAFQRWLYAQHPGLESQSYEKQLKVRTDSLFGVADFYSSNLKKLGHEAYDIHTNNEVMQKAWAQEHGIRIERPPPALQQWQGALRQVRRVAACTPLRYLKPLFHQVLRSLDNQQSWLYDILATQIKHYKPDVLLNQAMNDIRASFLQEMKPYVKLFVGQHAATHLSEAEDFSCYDLTISSFPPTVDYFRQRGILAELNRMGFEPGVLSRLEPKGNTFDVTFIGGFYSIHSSRVALLETLRDRSEQIKIWSPNIDHLSPTSSIRRCYIGQAWGCDMYQILYNSKITLNHHGDIPSYANNMRLYEATGVGAMLITDHKDNLHELFVPGKEVVAYRTPEECLELIRYYLEHDEEREAIAYAGQQRTLKDHSYYQRMQELVEIVRRYL